MDNTDNKRMKISERLKQARILSGLSQAHVADKLNIKRPTVSEIEAGRRKVSADELLLFADLYKVDTDWLLLRKSDEELETDQLKMAARELGKLSQEDMKKVLDVIRILPKKK